MLSVSLASLALVELASSASLVKSDAVHLQLDCGFVIRQLSSYYYDMLDQLFQLRSWSL